MLLLNNIKAFFSAALPWLTLGIMIAILAARGVSRAKNDKKPEGHYSAEGMCVGMCMGVCFGAMFNSTGLGISLGMLVGLAIGSCIQKDQGGNVK